MKVFIPGNVPSLKNSKPMGRFYSKTVVRYLQSIGVSAISKDDNKRNYKTRANVFEECVSPLKTHLAGLEPPHSLYFYFVRNSRQLFDFHNAVQIIADLLSAHDVVKDDNMSFFIPHPIKIDGKWYSVDKENAGVWIFTDSKGE